MSGGASPVLPILDRRGEIEAALRAHQVVVVCGETGSGKTTQLPRICLEMGLAGRAMIAHTQPRRLAARAVAARIAEEMGVRLGGAVGVKVRFQDQTSRETRIKLMTDGMLLAELQADPELRAYGVVIIDEAHERSLNIDFLLGYLKRLLPRRSDLKVVVTSATIDPARFSAYFGGAGTAPVIEVSGRMYPVRVRYMAGDEEALEEGRVEPELVADAVEELARPSLPEGDVLVFLPGEREIRVCGEVLRRRGVRAEVLPLLARLTPAEQDRVFHPEGGRRVILATNVAETSLTVPRVRYVVDSGLVRQSRYDPARKVQRLPIEGVSRASANQRSGRCGRVAEGVCIRLYSEASYHARAAFTEPEIRRTNLASVVLQMKSLGLGAVEEFPFLDPPEAAAIKDACETLFELGAIDAPVSGAALTGVGEQLARLPLDPRVGRMLLAAQSEGCVREVTVLAGALSIQDPRDRPMGRQEAADRAQLVFRDETSDFMTLLRIWEQYRHAAETMGASETRGWCRDHFLSHVRMREWVDTVRQLRDVAEELGLEENSTAAEAVRVHRALLTGLASNVACRDGEGGSFDYRGVRGNVLSIFPGSALFKKAPKWIMAAEVVQTTRLYARTVARIEVEWLEELVGHMLERRQTDPHLDAETGEASAWERVTVNGIVVAPRRRVALAARDPARARSIFLREGIVQGKWGGGGAWVAGVRAVLARAREAEARLRRRGVSRSEDELVAWLEATLPASVCDPATLEAWASSMGNAAPVLRAEDVLTPDAAPALDASLFPSAIEVGGVVCPVSYALAPGKDEDGVTLELGLTELGDFSAERAMWLVPGMLEDLLAAMLKTLPKGTRGALEAKTGLEDGAAQCAGVMEFGVGELGAAIAEAVEVLFGVRVEPGQFVVKSLPTHLRMRVRVLDHQGKEVAAERDVAALQERLAGRIRKARAARARASFERTGLTSWSFGELPTSVEMERDGEQVVMYPALIDDGAQVRLTLLERQAEAAARTELGVRRLFALACADEVRHRLEAMGEWGEMVRQHQQLGSPAQLMDQLTCQAAERAFMSGKALPRSREEFESRLQEQWGRLAVATREVVEVAAAVLGHRAAVAQRLSGGTPRLWAESVADIREHAAYLMPSGFLGSVAWERLKQYPRYVEAMRERLFALREGGSGVEKEALQKFLPHWKRFTGWVAGAMSVERAREEERVAPAAQGKKAPLPQTRRNSPTVNVDAGAWAIVPGRLPAGVERYRWALEEARVGLFVARLAAKPGVTLGELEALWKKAEPPGG